MCTNQKQLRLEAYKLWGLGSGKVIYDFPKRFGQRSNEFFFKFDYDDLNASWPRIYAVASAGGEPAVRILAPIIVIRRYGKFQLDVKAWYDMPADTHEQILEVVDNQWIERDLSWPKKIANRFLPARYRFSENVPMEDYVFGIILHNGEAIVRAI